MITYYTELLLIFFTIVLIHAMLVSNRYTKIITPYFFNGKIDWNPNVDRLKALFSSVFLFAPFLLMKCFISYNSQNVTTNYIGLTLLILFSLFCLWFDSKKIAFFKEVKNVYNNTKTEVKESLKELKEIYDDLKEEVKMLSKETIVSNDNISSKLKDIEDNFSEIKADSLELRRYIVKLEENELHILSKNIDLLIEKEESWYSNFTEYKKESFNNFNFLKQKVEEIDLQINKSSRDKETSFPFYYFFINKEVFNKLCELLEKHNFYSIKNKPTVIEVCILIYKLDSLKIIDIHRKQNKICKSSAYFFSIPEFNESNLSTIINDLRKGNASQIHSEYLKTLDYLNQLKVN